ncbi:PrgI family protein [Streptomyces sp. NPDC057253]|uniref:PrgI family protein n=1 Tax=Streptomyces sp. NPDC057253 TaxID=3346069 RepID=UPI0036323685
MTQPVRIPTDIDREDTLVANLTARQLTILATTGIVLYGLWSMTRAFVPLLVFLIPAVPIAATAAFLTLGKRDGVSLDRLVMAALRQRTVPRIQVAAPDGILPPPSWLTRQTDSIDQGAEGTASAPLRLPAEGVSEAGVIDLGSDGIAMVAVCGTVNFALRTPTEQDALVAVFGRYLHSLTAPVQILVRSVRLDVSAQISELRRRAVSLPHPALEAAAREHADFLDQLALGSALLCRQVLLILREPAQHHGLDASLDGTSPLASLARRRKTRRTGEAADPAVRRADETRVLRRVQEAAGLLGPVGVRITLLDAGQATAVLAGACNPDSLLPASSALAGADEVITTGAPAEEATDARHSARTAL